MLRFCAFFCFFVLVKKYGRASVVVFAVAAGIGLAVILMGLDGILNIVYGEGSMAFSAPC